MLAFDAIITEIEGNPVLEKIQKDTAKTVLNMLDVTEELELSSITFTDFFAEVAYEAPLLNRNFGKRVSFVCFSFNPEQEVRIEYSYYISIESKRGQTILNSLDKKRKTEILASGSKKFELILKIESIEAEYAHNWFWPTIEDYQKRLKRFIRKAKIGDEICFTKKYFLDLERGNISSAELVFGEIDIDGEPYDGWTLCEDDVIRYLIRDYQWREGAALLEVDEYMQPGRRVIIPD